MSESVRPPVPRPSSKPAPPRRSAPPPPPRARMATLPLDEEDIVGVSVAPLFQKVTPLRPPPIEDIDRGWDDDAPRRPVTLAPPPSASVPPPAPGSIAPPPLPSGILPKARLTMSDPTDVIFERMYGLAFARGLGEAAELCAETLARALGARAVVIHTHDLTSRELRAIGAHGDGDFDILGSSAPSDDDLVASAVICNQRSVTMTFDGELSRLAPKRLHAVGAPRTVVAAPALSWGRCLAIVEVIDADPRFAAQVADSAKYVADHLAQFLATHAAA